MLIVIPVGPFDALNLSLQTQAIKRLGVVENPVLIVSVPSLQTQAEEAAATLGATVALTHDEFANGWPVGPDRMFIWTLRHLAEIGNDQPWLWLEPDACPVKAGWDVTLANDYREAGKPYYGFTRPTAWRDADGNLAPIEGDNMMLGVGIYPPNMHLDSELAPLLVDLGHANPQSHPPFTVGHLPSLDLLPSRSSLHPPNLRPLAHLQLHPWRVRRDHLRATAI